MHALLHLLTAHHLCTADDNNRCMLHLVFEKLTKVLHVHLCLFPVNHSDSPGNLDICIFLYFLDCPCHIRKFPNTGRLDDHPIRLVLLDDLLKRFAEITNQRAADASGIHLSNFDSRIL